MRVLIDECVPRRVRTHLPGHDVHTVPEMGWSGKKDGDLLRLMIGDGFEVLVTVDLNIRHQQNLPSSSLANAECAFGCRTPDTVLMSRD